MSGCADWTEELAEVDKIPKNGKRAFVQSPAHGGTHHSHRTPYTYRIAYVGDMPVSTSRSFVANGAYRVERFGVLRQYADSDFFRLMMSSMLEEASQLRDESLKSGFPADQQVRGVVVRFTPSASPHCATSVDEQLLEMGFAVDKSDPGDPNGAKVFIMRAQAQ